MPTPPDSTYPGVFAWVSDKLPDYVPGTPSDLDREIRSVLRQILSPSGTAYSSLSGDVKDAVDEAAGLRTAIRVYGSLVTGGVSLGLLQDDDGESKRQYEGPDGLLAQWASQANVALGSVPFIGVSVGFSAFGLNGRSRQNPDCGCSYPSPYGGAYPDPDDRCLS